jgi:ribosome-associated translation inhibitor RaiA
VPVHIRNFGSPITEEDREYLRRKLAARLDRFGRQVERASVRLEDVNGPRGGMDKRSRIKVVLTGLPSVTVEDLQHNARAAIDGALRRVASAVRRALERRRGLPPVPPRARTAAVAASTDE